MTSRVHLASDSLSASTHLEQLVDVSPDPERVERYFAEFYSRHPQLAAGIAADPSRSEWLLTIFGFSHFLSEEILRHPEWLSGMAALNRSVELAEYKQRLSSFFQELSITAPTAADLASFRRKELLRIVLRDALRIGTLAEITEELSHLADAIVGSALEHALSDFEARYGHPQVQDPGGTSSSASFAVLALGKLGGNELNYSSDIDLMFVYSENGETTGYHRISNKEFFKKVANHLTNLLSTYTAAGLCYRVDLRLRPEGTLGEVCLSLAAAKEYYSKRARDWELQMLIKARVAAGDEALGRALLDFVEPSIYSTTTDFSTIEAMSATRERMGEKLARKRLKRDDLDVKLARGGIRDIEFLVQCLQRLHGGRESWIRHAGTLFALSRLHDKGLLATTEYLRLVDAYEFLRNLEHRLQFEDDRQTHALPSNPLELERIARRMPNFEQRRFASTASTYLLKTLNQHLENVQGIYESIVHAQRPLYYTPAAATSSTTDAPATPFQQPSVTRDTNPPALVNDGNTIGGWVAQIHALSPFLSQQLTARPDLVSEIERVTADPDHRPAFEASAPPLNDVNGLGGFFKREMFRILSASVCLPEPVLQTLDRTSALAEFVIARAYRIAREQAVAHARLHETTKRPFAEPESEMMIVTLGRLGMREFDLASDADLLFIIPDSETPRHRFWIRVAEHVIDILTAYNGEGPILSLDTRLRPNGREGMLVQSESKYVEYFSTKAEAWEGIAYMKARGVAGDTERATNFLTELQQVDWRRYGQSGRSKQDLRQMRMRLQREQGSFTPLKAGEGGYYDADFILMYLRLKGAGMFFKSLNTPERIDILEKMGHLDRANAEFLLQSTTFFRALDHAVRVVTGRAEEKLPASSQERGMVAELVRRWTSESLTASTLEPELDFIRAKMRRVFDSIFTQ